MKSILKFLDDWFVLMKVIHVTYLRFSHVPVKHNTTYRIIYLFIYFLISELNLHHKQIQIFW